MHPRNDHRSESKLFIRGNTKICPSQDDKQFDRRGIEIKMDFMQKDGTQSWMVSSRDVGRHVTELSEENALRRDVFKHWDHWLYRSNNEIGRIHPSFQGLITTIAESRKY